MRFRRNEIGLQLAPETVDADTAGTTLKKRDFRSLFNSSFFLSVFALVEIKRSAGMMAGFPISSLITSVRIPIIAPRTVANLLECLLDYEHLDLQNRFQNRTPNPSQSLRP